MNTNTATAPVRVEIFSDVQCIWCYIANARFRAAVKAFGGDVEIVPRSFPLQPNAPVEVDREEHIRKTGGMDEQRREQILRQLTELTAAEGLAYDPDRTKPTNSRLALELLHHAGKSGRRLALNERLFSAYFAEGRHIGRVDELVQLAAEVGLDAAAARDALTSRRHRGDVDNDMERARFLGVQGAPFYAINDKWGISGAQPTSSFIAALEQAAKA